jgi:hypothetical protein
VLVDLLYSLPLRKQGNYRLSNLLALAVQAGMSLGYGTDTATQISLMPAATMTDAMIPAENARVTAMILLKANFILSATGHIQVLGMLFKEDYARKLRIPIILP